ncbi:MAG TPA: SDR family NAD(P)-dependent oxidoreductase [Thermoanaerobaculia bacterium]|nr:SDR family NAD(P)-dependent oxidoreductase [Thermoanaerobaculia bacterium]
MATFKETVLGMVARKELSAAQAMNLIQQVRESRAAQAPASRQPVAIIGMSGRFPGANDPDTFWRNIRGGVSSIHEIPRSRWNVDELYDPDPQAPGKSYCQWGGFVEGIDEFDSSFFNISAKEAQLIDPQQRLFLEEACRAIEDAGLTAAQLDGVRCGVFAGAGGGDFIHQISAEGITPDAYAFMGNASSILAARISYHLNLKGPSLAVDTACSSSLVAIHLACESLALGTSDLALAGGVCILNTPNFYLAGSKAGMLSKSGACRTFDQDADGFVPAEGVGVVVLKPLDRAIADGDRILGVIEGSAINQDGRTNGITAPSAPSQTALELEVYEKFGIPPETIGYVEAHGTGTRLGDPIEIEALTAAFRKHTDARGFCAIGSSKTNIGHAMSASGMAGVIKVLKALEAAELPPSLHFENENEAIGFAATPFRVNTSVEPWPERANAPRRAAVSSFGFSGTNVHLVIAEAPRQSVPPERKGMLPFVVSAKSRAALAANCAALAEWLERTLEARLDSVSWTLLGGRNHFEHRVVLRASTREELIAALRRDISDTRAEIPDPRALFGTAPPPKVSLPTYRFERRSHTLGSATKPKQVAAPHPLLDESGPGVFRSRWNTSLPFLRDHKVVGRHILPGACLVEMALSATRQTSLEEIAFLTPLQVSGGDAGVELTLQADGTFVIRSGGSDIASGRTSNRRSATASAVDLDAWTAREPFDVDALLRQFEAAGVILGPYCRGLRRLWLGEGEAVAELQLPAGESRSLPYYTLHPTLVDGAFQAAMALLARTSSGVLVPASIGSVEVQTPLPAICYAHVRLTGARAFDLAFLDENGATLATLERFSVAELHRPAEPALRYYRPEWAEVPAPAPAAAVDGVTLVVRAPDVARLATGIDVALGDRNASTGTGQWQVDAASPTAFRELLATFGTLARVVFLGGSADMERDVVALLHLIQALPQHGLHVTVCAPPENGGVLGFAQTVSREQTHLRFTIIESATPPAELFDEPGQEAGAVLAERNGRRFQRTLAEHVVPSGGKTRFRHGGVYLIAGGAGGIGLELAQYLVRTFAARVVLLGRRERELALPESIVYRRADVTDAAAVAAVIAETKAAYGAIHGVIHAAMALRDVLAQNMDAAMLRSVLAPKLRGSEVLADAFAGEPLDFFAFFSSANSFFGNAGQANYAAASMAQDAIARRLAAHAPFPVRIVNWGFWGDVGAVATPLHRRRALEHGIGAIRVDEGLRALEACLGGDELQLMPMKVEPETLARMGLLAPRTEDDIATAFAAVENYGRAALRRFVDANGRLTLATAPKYARLRAALEAIAATPVEPHAKPDGGWTATFAKLIDRCLDHYPEVLSGAKNAAEVLFPGGSTEWVAPLYRDNPIVDRYNRLVAEEVAARVQALLRSRERVRVFEMGAGTGGTSRGVLEALAPFAGRIEFVFSDLSAGLVRQAKSELGARYPFARFLPFDIEKEPAAQGFDEYDYDLVFASNALHATRNIAVSLRNAHRLLRDGGVLLLNEGIRLHDFSTLTFGLTDGWWLFDDAAARLPHSPLLDETLWRKALVECFDGVETRGGDGASQAVFIATARPRVSPAAVESAALDVAQVERVIRRHVAAVLSVAAADVDPDRRFSELGVDSIPGVDLVKRINETLHTELPVTVLFDYPSVRQLARHVATLAPSAPANIAVTAPVVPVPETAPSQPEARSPMPIAIVGLAGRFPGARNAAEFWRDLRDGVCRIGEVPRERWDVHRYYDPDPTRAGKSPCKWGGFVDDVDKFDPAFFHMSGAEAEYTDPQQRLFVEEAWHALEDAGYAPAWLDGKRCGVFVGAAAGDYIQRMTSREPQPQAFLGNGVSVLASRISYLLNLRGPALAVDTACSSSLLAVHLACQSIRSGECDLALAGGVFVSTTSSFHYLTGRLGMLSPTGLCRAFDDGADGFIPGEGAGAVVLRPLDAALRDGDFVYGVIAGSGANQDGHSNGITAPSAVSQAELEAEVYERAKIDPRTIGYVEAHGTGTRLGDPLEIEGLTRAFRQFTNDRGFCAIGSVKTNIGHAGPAAGIAGLIKVLLAMRHREIPPSLHFDRPNRAIDFAATPFFVATERRAWSAAPMRAAVSAFGLSGTNVHLVVEEPPQLPARALRSAAAPLFAVSAMSEESLRDRVAQLEEWLATEGREHDSHDVAYTLTACRRHFAHRAVLKASADHPLAARYLAGEEIDWAAEYPPSQHRRIPLPGYPFSRERYWIPDEAEHDVQPTQDVHTFGRVWTEAAGEPASAPESVALIGATEAEVARLQSLLGVRVSRELDGAAAIALMPRCHESLDKYLETARRAGSAGRVLVAHGVAEHAAVATAAFHHSLRFIHPRLHWQTLETSSDPIVAIARELRTAPGPAEVRHRDGVREEHRAVSMSLPQTVPPLRQGGVWWITGGTGSIGTRVARWLVERCNARVIVTARRAPAAPLGRNIEFLPADAADRTAMQRVRETIRERYGALHGVIHAAGFIDAPLLTAKNDSRAVLAPKIDGAAILDELTRDGSLDAFVLFSSLSAIAGDFGQCDYAAANRHLESFAEWRAARRPGRTVAIHWPLWADGGMHLPQDDERRYLEQAGFEALRTDAALRVFEQALAATAPVVIVACGNRERAEAMLGARPQLPHLEETAPVAFAAGVRDIERVVLERTAAVVRLPIAKLTPDSRFSDVGLDSLYMKDLAAALATELRVPLTPTAFFEHQTVGALAGHITETWGPVLAQPDGTNGTNGTDGTNETNVLPIGPIGPIGPISPIGPITPIAIIGMSGRFPQSADLAALWSHLIAGDDCVTEVPAERWDWREYHSVTGREHDKSVSRWGGFMPGLDQFDSAFFGISPREAVYMDPQHRLFLQSVWSAFEDAGIRPSALAGRNVGVWAGAQLNEYMRLIGDAGEARAQAALGNTQTMLANRVSYWFDFRGPSQTVDTACSSSLVAVHRAVQALRSGECELAVAGGVSAILSPDTYVLASQLGMLSVDGRCKTFDRSANGYVKGEGVGAVLLKPLARALADDDHVYGVIRATAEGHGGKASSLTAPNPQAQAQLVLDAWTRAGVPIDSVSYIETHGTGTELGDPLEVEALTTAFQAVAREQGVELREGFCGLGSIKSNIGHLEPAAGIAGLIKVLLAMQHRTLPPTIHVEEVNPYLHLEGSPFRLVREQTAWTATPLRAGVSAFGFGGSNAHAALEEAPPRAAEEDRPFLASIPLSAKTPAALREMAANLCEHLERQPVQWRDLVFTLQDGRERFEHGITLQASSVNELVTRMRAWLGGATIAPVEDLAPLANGRRIPLPTYPFARTRIWYDRKSAAPEAVAVPAPVQAPVPIATEELTPPIPLARLEEIRSILAELLYLDPSAIADDARFVDLGLDSILAVEFAKKLKDRFTVDLRATRLYDYSTVAELAAHIDGGSISPAEPAPLPEVAPVAAAPVPAPPVEEIRLMLAELLYLDPSAIADDARFVDLGLDSILAVEFAKKLKDRFGADLRATRLYDYSTVLDLAGYIGESAAPAAAMPLPAPEPVVEPQAEIRDTDIAIIGISGCFPGAPDLNAFWRNLAAGVDSIVDVPRERWSVDELYPHKTYCRKGGFLEDIDQFDPLFFKISPQEAEWMDPQQRLFLEQAWLALEDAGLPDRTLSGLRCAVFAGAGQGDYFRLMEGDGDGSAQFGIGNVTSILAARISYFLNLKGPAVSLDTACSSSLVATHLAAQALRGGECDLALAGGVSLMITPQMHLLTSQTRMLSPEGQCKTFDAEANGFVPGEGVGVAVLKRLRDAVADGDRIYAVIRGSGTNQDGHTNGITAPSAQSQTALQVGVYERFGIDPSTITCVEAHGTGTKLGDPIEIDALTDAFRRFTPETQYCAIGSVKTNIGHTLPAAGMAGLLKSVLMLRARQIAPSLHCRTENEEIDFARSPFYVNRELRDWQPPAGVPRRVAVSSFGFSGTNAHLVLEEWRDSSRGNAPDAGPWSFVLSARTRESLRRYAHELAGWLEGDGADVPLSDIAFTLAERRSRFAQQRVVNAADRRTLFDRLRRDDDATGAMLPVPSGRVVSLPPYPFQRRRFWVPVAPKHPLVDNTTHGMFTATATKRLTAEHELLAQHVVAGTPTLPGAAYLEMALKCGAEAAPASGAPALRNVIWTRPFRSPDETLSMTFHPDGDTIRFETPYCRGQVVFGEPAAPRRLELHSDQGERYGNDEIYAAFERLGLQYGPALRRIEWLRRDGSRIVARLSVPADTSGYVLDPRVIDSALQTPIGFAFGRMAATPAMLPYALDRVVRHAPLTNPCYAVTTLIAGETPRFDISIVSENGDVLVDLHGFAARAVRAQETDVKSFLHPRWKIAPVPAERPQSRERVLILRPGVDHGVTAALARQHQGRASVTSVLLGRGWKEDSGDPLELDHRSPDDWSRLVQSLPSLGRVYFLGGLSEHPLLQGAALDDFQEVSALSLFRFVRAWVRADRTLPEIVIVTNGVFRVLDRDLLLPQAASLAGLAGVISQEFPGVEVSHVDVESVSAARAEAIAAVATRATGSLAWRNGQLFTQALEPIQLRAPSLLEPGAFRRSGVYVIAGGSGGIGGALAEHLAREHHARIALVGRRAVNEAIAATLERIAAAGGEAIYVRADIGDLAEVEAVRDAALAKWGAVHGVIHSALALHDQTMARLDDGAFRETLRAKGRGTCLLAQAFRDVPLDWLLIFSSTISFTRNAGQSSYAAASTLQDAIGAALSSTARWPVKTVNWGYWGEVGVVATERHRARARNLGVGSLTLHDAVDAIERILSTDLDRIAVIRLLDAKPSAPVWHRHEELAPSFPPLDSAGFVVRMTDEMRQVSLALSRLETCGRRILGTHLRTISEAEVEPKYRRLFATARAIALDSDERTAALELEELRQLPEIAPFAELLAAALRDFPLVVTGRKSATEVLFPRSSSALVEAVYRGNPLTAEYELLVGRAVAALAEGPLSILEVGAGTGSTSRVILDSLASVADRVHYHFTDVSPHFVRQAESTFAGSAIRPRFSVLDLERDPLQQGLTAGAYDVVIAANVIHATRSIAVTLQRVKNLLKRGGLLVLAEMAGRSDFSTMTFGLTEGWWQFEDAERRQAHSPLLNAAQWESSLAEAGFRSVRTLGAMDELPSGQVLVVAESDGWCVETPATTIVEAARESARVPESAPVRPADGVEELRAVVSTVLRMRDDELENDALFEDYGVDSLVAIDILQKLEARYGALPATLLHEHNTLSRLAAHLATRGGQHSVEPALVTLGGSGDGPRTFWVHSVLGEIDWVGRLAQHLPASWPVHALRAPFVRHAAHAYSSLEAMAASYLAEVRAMQPHGPYVLGGYSFGGAVAFEMARQLLRDGERIQWLVLLDAFAPGSAALRSLRTTSWDGFLPKVVGALLERSRETRPSETDLAALTQRLLEIANQYAPLLDAYAPVPCAMNTLLFRNRHSFVGPASPLGIEAVKIDDDERDHGWTRWLGAPPRIVEIDTDHFSLGLEPAIGEVARQLVETLDPRAEAVFNIVCDHVHRVLPGIARERITLSSSLRELGANSLDRVEVATLTMEDLKLTVAPTQLASVQNIAALVDVFLRHLRDRDNGGSALRKEPS